MKAIQLTTEHREKLLEMCKELFPEYNNFWFSVTIGHNFILEASIPNSKILVPALQMHWFEFCMTYLCDKIFLPKGESRLDGIKGMDYYQRNENMHPIDYFYSEFKKLKT